MIEKAQLAQVVLDIAIAKRDRKAKKTALKVAINGERLALEAAISSLDAGIEASKVRRDMLISELLN